jgi:Rap1a immunity proteins
MRIRMLAALLSAAALAIAAVSASAEKGMGKEPGTRLLSRCEAVQPLPAAGGSAGSGPAREADAQACVAFIEGFVWGHAWASWREARDMWFCLPQGFSGADGVPVVVDYLRAHPDRLEEDAHLLVFLALTAAFPCK